MRHDGHAGRGSGVAGGEPGGAVRALVLWLVLAGMAGLGAELFFLEHVESAQQWIPLVALAFGLVTGLALALRPSRATVRLFQAAMASFVAAGVLGVYFHFRGNAEFEVEMDAGMRGLALLWASLHGATPALAPGSLAHLGLLGLAATYRHPAVRNDNAIDSQEMR